MSNNETAHLEDVKRFELDILTTIFEQVHHHLEVVLVGDVARHDLEVGSVEQDLAQQLERLSLRDVVGRLHQQSVRAEELRQWKSQL